MKSILSVAASSAMSLMIGTGPNANSRKSLFLHEAGIVLSSGVPPTKSLRDPHRTGRDPWMHLDDWLQAEKELTEKLQR